MSASMRAKVECCGVTPFPSEQSKQGEDLAFRAVARSDDYPDDGSDENNTYAKFSPSADFRIACQNERLFGCFEVGEEYYVDFTPVESADG